MVIGSGWIIARNAAGKRVKTEFLFAEYKRKMFKMKNCRRRKPMKMELRSQGGNSAKWRIFQVRVKVSKKSARLEWMLNESEPPLMDWGENHWNFGLFRKLDRAWHMFCTEKNSKTDYTYRIECVVYVKPYYLERYYLITLIAKTRKCSCGKKVETEVV